MAAADRRFVVSCLHCKRIVMVIAQIGGEQLDRLRAHLFACCPDTVIGPTPGVEAVMRCFRVVPTTNTDPPPDPDAA